MVDEMKSGEAMLEIAAKAAYDAYYGRRIPSWLLWSDQPEVIKQDWRTASQAAIDSAENAK